MRPNRDPYALHRKPAIDANHAYCMAVRETLKAINAKRKPSLMARIRAFFGV